MSKTIGLISTAQLNQLNSSKHCSTQRQATTILVKKSTNPLVLRADHEWSVNTLASELHLSTDRIHDLLCNNQIHVVRSTERATYVRADKITILDHNPDGTIYPTEVYRFKVKRK